MYLNLTPSDRLKGLLIGIAVGDSVGLSAEGISRSRNHKLFQGKWEQRFVGNCGILSDDTEHTIFVAQCLIASGNPLQIFQRRLA